MGDASSVQRPKLEAGLSLGHRYSDGRYANDAQLIDPDDACLSLDLRCLPVDERVESTWIGGLQRTPSSRSACSGSRVTAMPWKTSRRSSIAPWRSLSTNRGVSRCQQQGSGCCSMSRRGAMR